MTITRTVKVCTFVDAAGVSETEPEDIDIEVEVKGTYVSADPDCGKSAHFEIQYAVDADSNQFDLTDREYHRAQAALLDAWRHRE